MTSPREHEESGAELRRKTAGTLKWNTIDRVSSQVLYAVVGVVLARILTKQDYGLVGILLVFQAFATIFVDSGFGAALLQKKNPDEKDYSTVFWFNLVVGLIIYLCLFFVAPLFSRWFGSDELPGLSKVMFLTFILNALGIVQTNRLMKRMDVREIAIGNLVGLVVSGVIGVWAALKGFGAWALVWQSVSLAGVKTGWLWLRGGWIPKGGFHLESLRNIYRVGMGVFSSSFLNTLSLNIYTFVIAAFYSLGAVGVYTQADKWSKMGSASISQILTSSFVPLLARFQDDGNAFIEYVGKVNRFTSFILFPSMIGLAAVGAPIFHLLFGVKWDEAIPLFQILSVRGIFVVLISLYCNFLLAKGYARTMFTIEIIKDAMIFVAILATVFFKSVELLVWGQLGASALTWLIVIGITGRHIGMRVGDMLLDMVPYFIFALITGAMALLLPMFVSQAWLQLLIAIAAGGGVYFILLLATGRQKEVLTLIRKTE